MIRKLGFGLLWLSLIGYAFWLAPPDQPETVTLIQHLATGQWTNINPLVVSLFNLMGVWPLIYACVLLFDGRGQKIPAWPFASLSFGVGAFALLPYLALRQPYPQFSGSKNLLLKVLDSRWTGLGIAALAGGLLGYGVLAGDWSDFIRQWQTSRFIHVMSLDFCILSLVFPALLGDDLTRRGLERQPWFWLVALLPLIGPVLYLCLRPSLAEATPAQGMASEPVV